MGLSRKHNHEQSLHIVMRSKSHQMMNVEIFKINQANPWDLTKLELRLFEN